MKNQVNISQLSFSDLTHKSVLFYIFRLKTAFSHSWEKGSGWIERAPIPA
jgi:hypothetical protein